MGIQKVDLLDENLISMLLKKMEECKLVSIGSISNFNRLNDFRNNLITVTKLLKEQEGGFYYTRIIKKRNVPVNYRCYQIEGFIKADSQPVAGETHWLFFHTGIFEELHEGDYIRFKPEGNPQPLRDFQDIKSTRYIHVSELYIEAKR